ncbi:prostatic acid phosphatase like protein [Danaus plexippus plexippus]|uniref:acid phosphatase n=1 Tax=Danaus plexippus plexippus TaxID=278856 RepID=A0A212EID3_DANPL|nr:prostatic acid phosphatase like protein [Danaus plexippus plexippus]
MLVLILLLISLTSIQAEKSVKYAAVVFRHGDRTPVNQFPTDPYNNQSLWPVKFGELTNLGKRQHYMLGKWIRKRYSNLISKQFDPSEVYIRSTDVDRTLMSAQANLAGLYPPTGKSVWNKNLMWQPIPVHTKPEKEDELLAMKRKCIPYTKEKEKYEDSPPYKDRLSKYNELMDYLTAYTGMKIKDYTDINDIYNVLFIESLYNFTLPSWTQSVYPDKMKEPACYSFFTAAATPLMARLLVGPLFKEIVTTMDNVIANKDDSLKLSIYSGHDFTIGNILTALDVFDGKCPAYTSTIIFELLEDSVTKKHFIRVSYKNTVELVEPKILDLPNCGKICSYKKFIDLYDNLITVDWTHECNKKMSIMFAIAFFASVFTVLYFVHKTHFERITNQHRIQLAYANVVNQNGQQQKFSYI